MSQSLQAQLCETLQGRRDTIAGNLHEALARTSFVPFKAAEARQNLVQLTEQIVELLFTEPFEREQAEAVGAALVRLRYVQPEALGQVQEVLARQLVEGLPAAQVVALQPRLAALLGGLTVGFFRQARETILAEQEQIHRALITAHQRATEALRESEETARVLLNAPADAMSLLAPDGTILALNEAAAKRLGKRADELIGACVFDLFSPDVAERRKRMSDQAVRSGEPIHFEDERGERWFSHRVYPIFDTEEKTKVVRLAIVARDITERKQAEETLRNQAQRLRILHEIDTAILAAQPLEEISRAVLDHVRQLVSYRGASVVLLDSEAREGTLLFTDPTSAVLVRVGKRFALDEIEGAEAAIKVLRRGEIHTTKDIPTLAQALPELRALPAKGLRAALFVPLIAQDELIGFLALGLERPDAPGESQIETIRGLANSLAIAIRQGRLFESVVQQGNRLRMLAARLAETEEAERRRLARDLHDLIGQNLTALGINLNLVRTHVAENRTALACSHLDEAAALAEETVERVRRVTADLRPPMLDDFGLLATLQWHGARFASQTGIAVTVQGEEPAPRLAIPVETALFRITQEALTNVAKHARAELVTVTVSVNAKSAHLVIADDGVGFDPAQLGKPDEHHGWGLLTMAERAEAVGGHCRIESCPQQGTRVIVEVAR